MSKGPLWEAVRGPGYCYHQSISLSPELAIIELNLTECSNLTKAYEATRKIFVCLEFFRLKKSLIDYIFI
jgi:Zn-dependent M16 (insulinase) family peptidase